MDETIRKQIDDVLAGASNPELPAGAMERLLARLDDEDRVVAMPSPRPSPRPMLPWSAALPLAASLALGVYLGAMGSLDDFLPDSVTGEVAVSDDENADLSGVTDAEAYAEEDVT